MKFRSGIGLSQIFEGGEGDFFEGVEGGEVLFDASNKKVFAWVEIA